MHRFVRRELLLLAVLLTSACGNDTTTTTPTPTTPTTVAETFVGVLARDQLAHTHTFAVPSAGTITATLASITPDSTVVIGFSIGTWNGTACQTVLANDQATQGSTITANLSAAGNLCVRLYDVGNIVNPETYQVNATHP